MQLAMGKKTEKGRKHLKIRPLSIENQLVRQGKRPCINIPCALLI